MTKEANCSAKWPRTRGYSEPARKRDFAGTTWAVHANPSPASKFPGSRELAGNFPGFWVGGAFLSLNCSCGSVTYGQIPYATEQGIFNAQQGISSAQQGISSVEASAALKGSSRAGRAATLGLHFDPSGGPQVSADQGRMPRLSHCRDHSSSGSAMRLRLMPRG